MPATSSMTIARGSFDPTRSSSRPADQIPTAETAAVAPRSAASPGASHQTASATGRLVTVPGANGA
jgi:hypothetical protein